MPRETERHQRKKWRTQECLASKHPLITSEGEKVKNKHPLLYRREKDRLTTNAWQVRRPDLRLELKFLVYGRTRCWKSSCDYRHPLVCRNYKSGNSCIHGNNIACIDLLMVRRNQAGGRQVRLLKGAVPILREKRSGVVYLKIQIQRSLFCGKLGKRDCTLRRDTLKNSQDALGTKFKFGERERPSRGVIQKGEPHKRNPCAPKFEERTPEETSRTRRVRPAKQHGIWREKVFKFKAEDKATFYSLVEI